MLKQNKIFKLLVKLMVKLLKNKYFIIAIAILVGLVLTIVSGLLPNSLFSGNKYGFPFPWAEHISGIIGTFWVFMWVAFLIDFIIWFAVVYVIFFFINKREKSKKSEEKPKIVSKDKSSIELHETLESDK